MIRTPDLLSTNEFVALQFASPGNLLAVQGAPSGARDVLPLCLPRRSFASAIRLALGRDGAGQQSAGGVVRGLLIGEPLLHGVHPAVGRGGRGGSRSRNDRSASCAACCAVRSAWRSAASSSAEASSPCARRCF